MGSAQKSFTMFIETRKSPANGALAGKPGRSTRPSGRSSRRGTTTLLHGRLCEPLHILQSLSAVVRVGHDRKALTTELGVVPVGPGRVDENPILSAPIALYKPGKNANQFICIAPDPT